MCIFNTSFAYLFWVDNNKKKKKKKKKKGKYPKFRMGYSDGSWYMGNNGHMYNPCGLSSPNVHIKNLICIYVLIG